MCARSINTLENDAAGSNFAFLLACDKGILIKHFVQVGDLSFFPFRTSQCAGGAVPQGLLFQSFVLRVTK